MQILSWCHSFIMTVRHAPFYPMSFLIHSHTCKSIHMFVSNNLRTAEQACMKIDIAEYCQKLFSHFLLAFCHLKTAIRQNLVIHCLIYTQCDWLKCHECTNVGKVKQLKLWWQLYVTWLPVQNLKFQATWFLLNRGYITSFLALKA
jgi:hypothetical protein